MFNTNNQGLPRSILDAIEDYPIRNELLIPETKLG